MASEAAKHIVAFKLAAAKPFNQDLAKALDTFYHAARSYQEKVLSEAQRFQTYGERRDFLSGVTVKQWDAHMNQHLEYLRNLGLKFSGLMIPDICQAFVAVYPGIKNSR